MSHPFEGWSKLNEGWDGGNVAVDEMLENAKTVFSNSLGAVLIALGILWGVKLLITMLAGVLGMLGAWVSSVFGGAATIVTMLAIPVGVAVGLVQQSLYRPVQLQAFEGKQFVSGAGEALGLAKEVLLKVALTGIIYGVAIGLGAIACGLGSLVAAFFFCQAPYLAATTELSPWESMRRSYELNKSYALPVILALGISFVAVGALSGCGTAILGMVGTFIAGFAGPVGPFVAAVGADILGFISGAIVLVVTGSLFTTIQSVERGVAFKR